MTDILTTIDNALRDYNVSADAMRWTPDGGGEGDVDTEAAAAELTAMTPELVIPVRTNATYEINGRMMFKPAWVMQPVPAGIATEFWAAVAELNRRPRRNQPRPLPIDGHAYRARRRNRRTK